MRILCWIAFGALVFSCPQPAVAHGSSRINVIVDTDAALDDVRALILLVQAKDVEVLAVVTSDGASAPSTGARNVREVLRILGNTAVPVVAGGALEKTAPPWRPMSESLGWSGVAAAGEGYPDGSKDGSSQIAANDLIGRVLAECDCKVVYLCFGPLTNLAAALEADPSIGEKIVSVYYYGTAPGAEPASWNTQRDPAAAHAVFAGKSPVFSFQLVDEDLLAVDTAFLETICGFETPAAELVCRLHRHDKVQKLVRSDHLRCWDETVALALLYPELCPEQPDPFQVSGGPITSCDLKTAYIRYLALLSGDLSAKSGHRSPVVLKRYPTDPADLRGDVAPIAAAIIERHGLEEWTAALLANEFHRHLGIYSLLGVKMGIRAREILEAGVDQLEVISRAGFTPPLSCLTDGLQVATGASLGRGTITVDPDQSVPAAVFLEDSRRLTLELKGEIAAQIQADIRQAVNRHGALTPAYWSAVRELSLRYWLEKDRKNIFDEFLE